MSPNDKVELRQEDFDVLLSIIYHVGTESIDFKTVAHLCG